MPGKKILIVDDEKDFLDVVCKRLAEDGYEVITAVTGKEAVQKTRSLSPDIILMDIILPDIDGPDVVKTLQDDPKTEDIPVIFLSGIVTDEEKDVNQSELKVGKYKYSAIGKPFTYSKLINEIKNFLPSETVQ